MLKEKTISAKAFGLQLAAFSLQLFLQNGHG
jgi:hypothetical protein